MPSNGEVNMTMLDVEYKMERHGAKALGFDAYCDLLTREYEALLSDDSKEEKSFQDFFEKHPCMLPIVGNINHSVLHGCLFSQPRISSASNVRIPDFMWIASNSASLIPVFIEIERPGKMAYRKSDDVQNAAFSQAEDQILEWKALLEQEREDFFERYLIPQRLRCRKFSPFFILIYGRRREFENNEWLSLNRAMKNTSNFNLMSFDRLKPNLNLMRFPSAKRTERGIELLHIPPTFGLGPSIAMELAEWSCLEGVISKNNYISDERKAFLQKRAAYWKEFATLDVSKRGIIRNGDWE